MPMISPIAISPHNKRGGINWSSYWSPLNFVIEGHSFVPAGSAMEAFTGDIIDAAYYADFAVGGSYMSMLEERAATVDAAYRAGHRNIMLIWIGSNDIQEEGDGAIFYAALKSYVQDRLARGWSVFCYTIVAVSDARAEMFEVERDIVNDLMKTDLAVANRVFILDTDTLSQLDDPTDLTYFEAGAGGNVHLSGLGYYLASGLFRTSLDTASSGVAIKATPASKDFTVEATGTFAGISTLGLISTGWSVLTLDGNAKFYTDALATTGESDTWVVTSSALPYLIYIKSSGGTANLKVIRDRVTAMNEWTSGTNALRLSGNITQLSGLVKLVCRGLNTISGNIALLTDLNYLFVQDNNTLSGDISGLTKLTFVQMTGSHTLTGNISNLVLLQTFSVSGNPNFSGSITNMTALKLLSVTGTNTISGDVTSLILEYVNLRGSNTLTGSINGLTNLTYFIVMGSNTLSGDPRYVSAGISMFYVAGGRISDYTSGANWSSIAQGESILSTAGVGYGLSVAEISLLLTEVNATRTAGRTFTINLTGSNASMADTAQGGKWGDFDGETTPSALATTYKALRAANITVTLNGIVQPGVSGDGTGFPVGFGDWYRS